VLKVTGELIMRFITKKMLLAVVIGASFSLTSMFATAKDDAIEKGLGIELNDTDIILNASDVQVLNVQDNQGSQSVDISTGASLEVEVEGGATGDFNAASISGTAVGNSLSLNVAGETSSSKSEGGVAEVSIQMGNSGGSDTFVSSVQANSGNQDVSVDLGSAGYSEVNIEDMAGSFNTSSLSATSVGNSVSVNVGGVVR